MKKELLQCNCSFFSVCQSLFCSGEYDYIEQVQLQLDAWLASNS